MNSKLRWSRITVHNPKECPLHERYVGEPLELLSPCMLSDHSKPPRICDNPDELPPSCPLLDGRIIDIVRGSSEES